VWPKIPPGDRNGYPNAGVNRVTANSAAKNARSGSSPRLIGKVLLTAALIAAGCSTKADRTVPGSATAVQTPPESTLAVSPTSQREIIVDDLRGPTQFVDGPGDWLLVAQINGDEDAKTGQIIAVNLRTKRRVVLFEGLDKPTGVAWLNSEVWIMERRQLVRAEWRGEGTTPGPIEVLVSDLPFNGRSEGTLTVTPDRRLLYETTGAIQDGKVVKGSGTLWAFDPSSKTSSPVAIGLKNAYAHTFLPDGRLATVEIGDNITDPPVEELNVLAYSGPDGPVVQMGWPTCPGDTTCPGVASPLTTFPVHSTPSGITADQQYAYISLFVTGEIQRVSLNGPRTNAPQRTVASDLAGPHTVMLRPDGDIWVSEHLAGRITAVKVPA
jgi:glucose/arabinose dehydrogenase